MEGACVRIVQDLVADVRNRADLWLMSTTEKLSLLKERKEKGDTYIDLFRIREDDPADVLMIGAQLLKDIDIAKHDVYVKMEEFA
jgi:hypothetical protein